MHISTLIACVRRDDTRFRGRHSLRRCSCFQVDRARRARHGGRPFQPGLAMFSVATLWIPFTLVAARGRLRAMRCSGR